MTLKSAETFVTAVGELALLDPLQQTELELMAKERSEWKPVAREAVQRGWLTLWQAQLIAKGRGSELILGSYVLLEQLGEGGMGKVYKAKHRLMGRVVALKIIRRERLAHQDAVRRFRREIQAAAQLTHPNVVLAYDADQLGELHFFAMEFIEGIDLSRLVTQRGPLPIGEACDYIRQAALGLQHAHERGLVHRDVKPSNLLVTTSRTDAVRAALSGVLTAPAVVDGKQEHVRSVVKILDMGLARVTDPDKDPSHLTAEGLIVGTPDFLAPEQARDSRSVDIRADIYGLGCTLYFLLTGQVPFPGGTGTEKMLKHALDPPPDPTTLRPEVPASLTAVMAKAMAKNPFERYQTPVELATALEPFTPESGTVRASARFRTPPIPAISKDPSTESQFRVPIVSMATRSDGTNRRGLLIFGIACGLIIGLLGIIALAIGLSK